MFRELRLQGLQTEKVVGEKGVYMWVDRAVYEACFRVSPKHASLWNEIMRKLRLKRRKMGMIVGEKGVDVGGQRACSKHVSGLVSNMLRCGVKCSGNCGCRGCRWRRSWGKRGYTVVEWNSEEIEVEGAADGDVGISKIFVSTSVSFSNTCRTAANRFLRSTSTIPTTRKRCCFWVRGLTLFLLLLCNYKS